MADRFADKLISVWHGSVSRNSTTGRVLPLTLVCWLALPVSPLIVQPNVETRYMGGVNVPGADVLRKMHASEYILRAAGQVEVPKFKKRVVRPVQQASTNVLSEDAAVFVLDQEVLFDPRWQLVVARVRADPDDSVSPVTRFAFLKQDIDTVSGQCRRMVRSSTGSGSAGC